MLSFDHRLTAAVNLRTLVFYLLLLGAPLTGHASHTVVVLGDSISAAYNIPRESGWVELFRQWLAQRGDFRVVNASLSGETTSGGLQRLPQLLQDYQPDLLIVELGANDGLRGQPITLIEDNLTGIVRLGKQHGAQVYLLGMLIPPNYGNKYTAQFHAVFNKVAKQENVPLMPFFLLDVATDDALMQEDRLHPNAKAQPQLLQNMLSQLPIAALGITEG